MDYITPGFNLFDITDLFFTVGLHSYCNCASNTGDPDCLKSASFKNDCTGTSTYCSSNSSENLYCETSSESECGESTASVMCNNGSPYICYSNVG
jgi:hypothetical protein